MGEMADLVDKERTSGAPRRRPAVDTRSEHEVVDDQLTTPLEQIEQPRLAIRPLEHIVLIDLDHRLPAPLRGQRISGTGGRLFLLEQLLVSGFPLAKRHD